MKSYLKQFKEMLWEKDVSIIYLTMGLLMFFSSIIQVDDPINKIDPNIQHPAIMVWVLVTTGFLTIVISPLVYWFIVRNTIMGFSFFLCIYAIVDFEERIIIGANGVWLVALVIYAFLFARSYKDLYADKERYIKQKN